jgi:hypothetical protein
MVEPNLTLGLNYKIYKKVHQKKNWNFNLFQISSTIFYHVESASLIQTNKDT